MEKGQSLTGIKVNGSGISTDVVDLRTRIPCLSYRKQYMLNVRTHNDDNKPNEVTEHLHQMNKQQ